MQPLVDEDDDNIIWDDCNSSEDFVPGAYLTASTAKDDNDINLAASSTPASKEGETSCQQDTPEERGTPCHVIGNAGRAPRNDKGVRSIGRELTAVKKSVDGILSWREEVDLHMSRYKEDMASVNRKLDLLINVILPPRVSQPPRPSSGDAPIRGNHVSASEGTQGVNLNRNGDSTHVQFVGADNSRSPTG
ncbi:hypothetical protein KC19_VG210600 [Ceratodon purpureus]|uniref:Uncharacterized protein n=1 Tax=Ceratodon purpureus TaxID=3225 RepID=A0A8T0HSV2_CERPU|nr:hypothetical protein KC19_VG210600 [Ceratodon purpureus]